MKKQAIPSTELVLNADNSVYHLHLKKEHIAERIILVGDQDRVGQVSKHFNSIDYRIQNREFITHTGIYNGKRVSVISSGIGTDNIDIVLNELYAAVNINPQTRMFNEDKQNLSIVRIGTSGALHPDINPGSFIISKMGLGLDGLMYFYNYPFTEKESLLQEAFDKQVDWPKELAHPYFTTSSSIVFQLLQQDMIPGITASGTGFYGPQGRNIRQKKMSLPVQDMFQKFSSEEYRITNFDMETSALYGLGKLFGFECCTVNAVVANRATGQFLENHTSVIDKLINVVLDRITN